LPCAENVLRYAAVVHQPTNHSVTAAI